jgi:hypothetical protein
MLDQNLRGLLLAAHCSSASVQEDHHRHHGLVDSPVTSMSSLLTKAAFMSFYTVGCFFTIVLQCTDLRLQWDQTVKGTCWTTKTLKSLSYTNQALNILTDIAFSVAIPVSQTLRRVDVACTNPCADSYALERSNEPTSKGVDHRHP